MIEIPTTQYRLQPTDPMSSARLDHRAHRRRTSRTRGRTPWRRIRSRLRRLRSLAGRFIAAPALTTLSLLVYVVMHSVDMYVVLTFNSFVNPDSFTIVRGDVDNERRSLGSQFHGQLQLVVYALAALLAAAHRRELWQFATRNLHYILLFAALLAGVLWSVNPGEVVRNVIQVGVAAIIAMSFALKHPESGHRLLWKCLLFPLVLIQLASLYLFSQLGVDYASYVASPSRFGGLAGHPNTLGAQSVFGAWAAMMLLTDRPSSLWLRLFSALAIVLFGSLLLLTGSATSTVGFVVVGLACASVRGVGLTQRRFRIPAIGAMLLTVLLSAGIYYLQNDLDDAVGDLTSSIDRDTSFTGRTDLWATARAAIAAKPILGWGFDTHESVTSVREFNIPVIHYHNGFLDTLVAGGAIVGLILLFDFIRFGVMAGRSLLEDPDRAGLFVAGFMLIIFNLSEYTLLRPFSMVYFLYLCSWGLLYVGQQGSSIKARSRPGPARTRRRRALAF